MCTVVSNTFKFTTLILYLCFVNKGCAQKCEGNFPKLTIPDSISSVPESKRFRSSNEYVINPNTTEITISCSSPDPVFWNISPATFYESLRVDLFSELQWINETVDNSTSLKRIICHTAKLSFQKISEGITGLYSCENIIGTKCNSEGSPVKQIDFYLYGGKGETDGGIMINYHTGQHASTYLGTIDSDVCLRVPCEYNTPTHLSVNITEFQTKRIYENVSLEERNLGRSKILCVPMNPVQNKFGRIPDLQQGVYVECHSVDSVDTDDMSWTEIYSSSNEDKAWSPDQSKMVLNVVYEQEFVFTCLSRQPITILTNYTFDSRILNTKSYKTYLMYNSELTIKSPPKNPYPLGYNNDSQSDGQKSGSEWKSIVVVVSCQTKTKGPGSRSKVIQQWHYTLVNAFYMPPTDSNQSPANNLTEELTPDDINGIKTKLIFAADDDGTFRCFSAAPESLKVKFVECSTFNECQMKSKLLYEDAYIFRNHMTLISTSLDTRNTSVRFKLPAGKPGMARCDGFQVDEMSLFYIGLNPPHVHYSLSKYPVDEDTLKISVELEQRSIYVTESIHANCSSPVMLLISRPIFYFQFQNSTLGIITDEFKEEESVHTDNHILTISLTIKFPSSSITGIVCVARQFKTISPFVWDMSMLTFTQNADKITTKETSVVTPIEVKPPLESHDLTKWIIFGTLLGIIILVGLAIIVILLLRRWKITAEALTEDEIKEFMQGRTGHGSSTEYANSMALYTPYDASVEVELQELTFDKADEIGSGEFGVVYKGQLIKEETITVAVKTVKFGTSAANTRALMAELKVLLYIKGHVNVVQLVGACTKNLIQNELLIIMEFCHNGDLNSLLRSSKQNFRNLVCEGNIVDSRIEPGYMGIDTRTLLQWALQISTGMEHISERNVIHGDLALRNVLLDSNNTAKIADFGLSKKLYIKAKYVRNPMTPLPWQWLAPESLIYSEFSLKSDVWSFGVTLWELFTLGATPYPGDVVLSAKFIKRLKNHNYRMPRPEFATYQIYNMALECWKFDPNDRPTFETLKSQLSVMCDQIGSNTAPIVFGPSPSPIMERNPFEDPDFHQDQNAPMEPVYNFNIMDEQPNTNECPDDILLLPLNFQSHM